uniref:Putative salivary lipocalin n=1 Tax=Amblyomma americanum TaxID=6943 RepID=A0A0C9R607_AMBAM
MEVMKCMLVLAVAFFTMAAANSKPNRRDKTIRIKDLTDINERLYIKWRNYNRTENRCHSATKKSGSGNHFVYTLRVRPKDWEHMYIYNTNMTTEATPGHTEHNAARYKFGPDYPEVLRELIYTNIKKDCFILKEQLENNKTGCQLVRTASTINKPVPPKCKKAYEDNCPGDKFELYRDWCQGFPDIIR